MSRGLGRMQRLLLEALVRFDCYGARQAWSLSTILWKAMPGEPLPPDAPKPHKLQRRPFGFGDRDNPSRAMASLCRRGLVERTQDGTFKLTVAGAAPFMPKVAWAIGMSRKGLEWREVQVVRTTEVRATLLFKGDMVVVSLMGLLGKGAHSSRHPGWTFTDQQHGLVAAVMEIAWKIIYGRAGMMPNKAAATLGLPDRDGYSADEIQAAFRLKARETHPDTGGSAEAFQAVTAARGVLLSGLAA